MLDDGSSLPIQGVSIDWDRIDEGSYLREIEYALAHGKKVKYLEDTEGENENG